MRLAVEAGNRWRLHSARQPLRFVDRQLFPLVRASPQWTDHHLDGLTGLQLVWSLRTLAAEVSAAPDELAFVPNATTGLNTVIKSLKLHEGDEASQTKSSLHKLNGRLILVSIGVHA